RSQADRGRSLLHPARAGPAGPVPGHHRRSPLARAFRRLAGPLAAGAGRHAGTAGSALAACHDAGGDGAVAGPGPDRRARAAGGHHLQRPGLSPGQDAMKVGVLFPTAFADPGEYLADARAFEAAGADCLFGEATAEGDALTILAALAAVTARIGLGVGASAEPARPLAGDPRMS